MEMKNYFCHYSAIVETEEIGKGTRIWALTHIRPEVKIGSECNIGDHCFIEDHVSIDDGVTIKNGVTIWKGISIGKYVFIGPNVAFTNDLFPRSLRSPYVKRSKESSWLVGTNIEEGASIGANATIICGINIGQYSLIGAGTVVTRDVYDFQIMVGNPARFVGYICRCGTKLASQEKLINVNSDYFKCIECAQEYVQNGKGLSLI